MVYLLLGSNMGDRLSFLRAAYQQLQFEIAPITQSSSIYETEAWGKTDQQSFYNMVVALDTDLSAEALLDKTQHIESVIGRAKREKWGPRQIDIDILLFYKEIINKKNLTIPHAKLHLRNFALIPLVEIAPQLQHPALNKMFMDIFLDNGDESEVTKLNVRIDSC